jgi:hypothetical protein
LQFGRYQGTLTNMDAPTDWVRSSGPYALDFDGTNDYVTGSAPALALAFPFTVSFWYYPRARAAYIGMVSVMTAYDETAANGWIIQDGANGNVGHVGMICGGTQIKTSSSVLNMWQHYTALFNGASSVMYRNGVVQVSGTTGTPSYSTTPVIKIASWIATNGYNNCLMDDVCVYNRALTAGEIRTLSRRRGIAYEARRNQDYGSSGFQSAWARQRAQLIGGGLR